MVDGVKRSVATEVELLAFANSIRQAGGATVIDELFPSQMRNPQSCLIATALNFGCQVDSGHGAFADGSEKWVMHLPVNLTDEQRAALAKVKGVRLRQDKWEGGYYLTLPKHIGNAAEAFDEGAAFQSYAVKNS